MIPHNNKELTKNLETAIKALEFYAHPDTYFAIGMFPDNPAGDLMKDFSETDLGSKPGKTARNALSKITGGWQ